MINRLTDVLDVNKRIHIIDSLSEALQRELPATNVCAIAWKIDDDKDEIRFKVRVFDRTAICNSDYKEVLRESLKEEFGAELLDKLI